jgi:hypothetical protein
VSEIKKYFPFGEYSVRYWAFNAAAVEGCRQAASKSTMELLMCKKSYETCFELYDLTCMWGLWQKPNALSNACFFGLEYAVCEMMRIDVDIDAQGGCYGNALQAALYEGYEAIV